MSRRGRGARGQLALFSPLAESGTTVPEEAQPELIGALAELLLEGLGEPSGAGRSGDDEPEDHS